MKNLFRFPLILLFAFFMANTASAQLDSTFGTNGTVRTTINGGGKDDEANSVAIQTDGKIVAAGFSKDANYHYAFAVARYNTDGTLDNTFGTNGTVRTWINGGGIDDEANSVAIQTDGKIVVAGYSEDTTTTGTMFAVARYNTDGTLDTTFGTNGTVKIAINGGSGRRDRAYSAAIQTDGKIVAAGSSVDVASHYAFALARLKSFATPLLGSPPGPQISLSSLSLNFGAPKVDQTASLTLKVSNRSIYALIVDSVKTLTKYFKVSGISFPDTIKQSDTTVASITFSPDSVRSYTDTLYVYTNASTSPYEVALSGSGSTTYRHHKRRQRYSNGI